MAMYEYRYALAILQEHFGPVTGTICDELRWSSKTKEELARNSELSLATVKQALRVLINFNFVQFKGTGNTRCEYSLLMENIVRLRKYPRFLLTIRKKYGKEAEFIIKKLLHMSRMSLYSLIIEVTRSLSQAHSQIPYSLSTIKNSVCELIENNFIIPNGRVTDDNVPVTINLTEEEKIPKIDLQKLSKLYDGTEVNFPQNELLWTVNFDRFLVEYRDEIIVEAIKRRIDSKAGIVMRHLLKLAYVKLDPWRPISNPIPMMMIRDSIGNDVNAGADIVKYIDQYIRVMEEDSSGIIGRSGEHSGAVIVCFKDFFDNMTVLCVSHVLEQKFGSKAARVFRLVQSKKFIEIEEIQRVAMLADKEAKHVTYKLLEENFIQMHELRKPAARNAYGPNKAFFLFYVDIDVIANKIIGMCHKASYNMSLKRDDERAKHTHLIDKKMQSDIVKAMMTEQGTSEEEIAEAMSAFLSPPEKAVLETLRKTDRKLFFGEMQIDETIFLLQCFITYNKTMVPESKLKKKK